MPNIYDIPVGPKNLSPSFPDIIWEQVQDYYVEILAGGTLVGETPLMKMGCCCSDDDIIICFQNSLGRMDTISFAKPTVTHETKSSLFNKSLADTFSRSDYGWQRFNINANDTYEAKNTCLEERDMQWAQELMDSPFAFLQFDKDVQIDDSVTDDYLPITILDGQFIKEANDAGAQQTVLVIKFSLSNTFFIQRN